VTTREYRRYLTWFGRQSKRIAAGKSRMEYPLTIEKWKRQLRTANNSITVGR
jgi:hypothetical protein